MPVNPYRKSNYDDLLTLLVQEYGFDVIKIHEHITELLMGDVPIMRVIYNEGAGQIVISFHLLVSGPQAIMMFDFIKARYKLVALAETYYESGDGDVFMGVDANVAYEQDVENHYISNSNNIMATEYKVDKDTPVILVSQTPIYEASHPRAVEDYKLFKDRKKW